MLIATYFTNRIPIAKQNNKTPFELLFHKPSKYDQLKSFGCLYLPQISQLTELNLALELQDVSSLDIPLVLKDIKCMIWIASPHLSLGMFCSMNLFSLFKEFI